MKINEIFDDMYLKVYISKSGNIIFNSKWLSDFKFANGDEELLSMLIADNVYLNEDGKEDIDFDNVVAEYLS